MNLSLILRFYLHKKEHNRISEIMTYLECHLILEELSLLCISYYAPSMLKTYLGLAST